MISTSSIQDVLDRMTPIRNCRCITLELTKASTKQLAVVEVAESLMPIIVPANRIMIAVAEEDLMVATRNPAFLGPTTVS